MTTRNVKKGLNMLRLKINRRLLYLVLLMFVAGAALAIGYSGEQTPPAQLSWQVYSSREPVLRLHVIASSDTAEDQLLKEQVAGIVKRQLSRQGSFVSVEDCLDFVRQDLPCLEQDVKAYLQEFAPGQQVSLTLTRSSFPLRAYGTRVFPPGQYLALKVVLGAGQGENWWCLLFPPLCVTLAESGHPDEPVKPGGEGKANGKQGKSTGQKEPVRWRLQIWEWLERWF